MSTNDVKQAHPFLMWVNLGQVSLLPLRILLKQLFYNNFIDRIFQEKVFNVISTANCIQQYLDVIIKKLIANKVVSKAERPAN